MIGIGPGGCRLLGALPLCAAGADGAAVTELDDRDGATFARELLDDKIGRAGTWTSMLSMLSSATAPLAAGAKEIPPASDCSVPSLVRLRSWRGARRVSTWIVSSSVCCNVVSMRMRVGCCTGGLQKGRYMKMAKQDQG